jgi:hypothetical protein
MTCSGRCSRRRLVVLAVGILVELQRRAYLLDPSLTQDHDLVRERDFEACIAHLRVPVTHRRAIRTSRSRPRG